MSKIRFFHFGNDQTYHFFRWVIESGWLDVRDLVSEAMDRVGGDDWFQMGEDVCTVARRKLAEMLGDFLEEQVTGVDGEIPAIGVVGPGLEDLTRPILKAALDGIDLETVAEAILIDAGKWAPDLDSPEAL